MNIPAYGSYISYFFRLSIVIYDWESYILWEIVVNSLLYMNK